MNELSRVQGLTLPLREQGSLLSRRRLRRLRFFIPPLKRLVRLNRRVRLPGPRMPVWRRLA